MEKTIRYFRIEKNSEDARCFIQSELKVCIKHQFNFTKLNSDMKIEKVFYTKALQKKN